MKVEIVEISQCLSFPNIKGDIKAYANNGKYKVLSESKARKVIERAKERFYWYFCPFDDVILDYRFRRDLGDKKCN